MNADEIFNAICEYSGAKTEEMFIEGYHVDQKRIDDKNRALEELRHLVAIRDDTDTAYPENPLCNDKC